MSAPSAVKIEANRANAQFSTGPRGETGKNIASCNAEKHNLTGGTAFVEGEDRAAYDEHCASQFRQYKPVAEHDIFLTRTVADSMWRLDRAHRMETELLEKSTNPFTAEDDKDAVQLQRLARYIAAIERTYYKAYNELKRINEERNKSTGIRYNIHAGYRNQPIDVWQQIQQKKAEKLAVQNEPTEAQMASLQMMKQLFQQQK